MSQPIGTAVAESECLCKDVVLVEKRHRRLGKALHALSVPNHSRNIVYASGIGILAVSAHYSFAIAAVCGLAPLERLFGLPQAMF
jgi:hypothetical protein